jgi:DNA-binding NarL/FixJ family response regulator
VHSREYSREYNREERLPRHGKSDLVFPSTKPAAGNDKIAIFDSNTFFLNRYVTRLKRGGFSNVAAAADIQDLPRAAEGIALTIIDQSCAPDFNTFFTLLQLARFRGYTGMLVLMSDTLTCEDLYRYAIIGISDFWIKGPNLQIENEIEYLLGRKPRFNKEELCPKEIADLGLFRTIGLSSKETEIIEILAGGFPRQCEIAARLGKNASYIHKTFSRIYEKLSGTLSVETTPQLAHLITICSLFK